MIKEFFLYFHHQQPANLVRGHIELETGESIQLYNKEDETTLKKPKNASVLRALSAQEEKSKLMYIVVGWRSKLYKIISGFNPVLEWDTD